MIGEIYKFLVATKVRIGEIARRISQEFLQSSSWHSLFIEDLIRLRKTPQRYLEIGIYQGETFNRVSQWASDSVGIDIDPDCLKFIKNRKNAKGFVGTIQEFAEKGTHERCFDFIFIDGDHGQDSVIDDFQTAVSLVAENGLILLHDTWPGTKEFSSSGFCGDAYLAVERLRQLEPNWSFVTIPVHPGLTICQKKSDSPESGWTSI